jgi:chromosome partitioning protein
MALVITVAQQKGGAGKTMIAANLAAFWATSRRVALLDIDPQRSLTRWHAVRAATNKPAAAIHLSDVAGWRMAAELDRLRDAHDVIIIDSPPQIETEAKLAIRAADLVLVPLQPSLPDLWAAEGTLKLALAERRPARVVLNRAPAKSALLNQVLSQLGKSGGQLLAARLGNRAGMATAFARGLGVHETAPKSVAAAELAALAAELEALLAAKTC